MNSDREMPEGIKILAVLNYIGTVMLLLFSIAYLFNDVKHLNDIIPVIIMVALAVLSFFIGRGLWKGQNWARIVSIICAFLGVLFSIGLLFTQGGLSWIVSLVINGLIGSYLLFSQVVKTAFE